MSDSFKRVSALVAIGSLGLLTVHFAKSQEGVEERPTSVAPAVQSELGASSAFTTASTARASDVTTVDRPRTADANVTLDGALSHPVVRDDGVSSIYARFRVQASAGERGLTPLDLALVIDRSASMTGIKLEQAKRAAHEVLDQLPAGSTVALIRFSNTVTSTPPIADLNEARELIDGIEVHGGTNLMGGWESGVSALHRGRPGVQRHILLISDGMPTVGSSGARSFHHRAREAAADGISTSTFSVGLDFDEEILAGLAEGGDGTFTFIDDGARIDRAVSSEVARLMSAVVFNTKLTISVEGGAVLEHVLSLPADYRIGGAAASLGTLSAGSTRDVLVRLQVDGRRASVGSLKAVLRYNEPLREPDSMPGHPQADSKQRTLELDLVASSSARSNEVVDGDLLSRVREVQSAEAVRFATGDWRGGQVESARQTLEDAIARNDAFLEAHGMSVRVAKQQETMRSLLAEIVSSPRHSVGSRRAQKKRVANSIEIIRGD